MSLYRMSLVLFLSLLLLLCACSSKGKSEVAPAAAPQPYSGEEEYMAARSDAQNASFAMMSISTCLTHFCQNGGPAAGDEERLAKMLNKLKSPELSRSIQGKAYKDRLIMSHSFFKGKLDDYIARSKQYREKLLAGGSLEPSVQDRVNGIDRDIAALGDIMGSWPVAEWACLVK